MMRSTADGLEALSVALLEEGGTLAEVVGPQAPLDVRAQPGPAQLAATGPRASGHEAEYELLLEMVREGILLHYGAGRVTPSADPDLALLLGDQLYALGLSRLAAMGDLTAVSELGDMISLIAQAIAAADAPLAQAIWEAGAVAVGWGGDPAHEQAKALARTGSAAAAGEFRRSAARLAARQ
jgi:hypothetical protein